MLNKGKLSSRKLIPSSTLLSSDSTHSLRLLDWNGAWQFWWMQMLTLLVTKMSFFNFEENVLFASDSWRLKKCNCTRVGRNFNFWVIFNLMNIGALEIILKKRADPVIAWKSQNDYNLYVLLNKCLKSSFTFWVLSISGVLI